MGEDEVEAGVLWGAGGRWSADIQHRAPYLFPPPSSCRVPTALGIPCLGPDTSAGPQGWLMRAFYLPGRGEWFRNGLMKGSSPGMLLECGERGASEALGLLSQDCRGSPENDPNSEGNRATPTT